MNRDAHRARLRRVALTLELDELQESVLLRVDERQRAVVLERHVRARAVGQEADAARTMTGRDALEQFVRCGVDREHRAVLLARHVDDLAVRANADAFGFLADLHGRHDGARFQIDDARLRRVFVGHVHPLAVAADRQLLGVGARMDDPFELIGVRVHLANPVGGAIGRRQRLRIDAGPGVRRSAQRHVQRFPVGAYLNAARPLAKLVRADDRLRLAVDHRQVARHLVRHVHAELGRHGGWRGCGGRRRRGGRALVRLVRAARAAGARDGEEDRPRTMTR